MEDVHLVENIRLYNVKDFLGVGDRWNSVVENSRRLQWRDTWISIETRREWFELNFHNGYVYWILLGKIDVFYRPMSHHLPSLYSVENFICHMYDSSRQSIWIIIWCGPSAVSVVQMQSRQFSKRDYSRLNASFCRKYSIRHSTETCTRHLFDIMSDTSTMKHPLSRDSVNTWSRMSQVEYLLAFSDSPVRKASRNVSNRWEYFPFIPFGCVKAAHCTIIPAILGGLSECRKYSLSKCRRSRRHSAISRHVDLISSDDFLQKNGLIMSAKFQ